KAMINEKQPNYFSYADWQQLNELEIERGKAQGRPRVKFTRIKKMVEAIKG
ncbi:MAG: NADP oxidoreductase, partial [Chloroflexi bacterium]|nr:NADP oxidoreductase [Chloroflexota bacterium]